MSYDNPDRITMPLAVYQEDIDQEIGVEAQQRMLNAGINENRIAQLRAFVAPLDKPITTDVELKDVQMALSELVSLRNKAKRICEMGRRPALMVQRAYLNIEKYVTSQIAEIEAPLEARKKAWVAEQERLKREEQERQDALKRHRRMAIEDMGFVLQTRIGEPDAYALGSTRIEVERVETAPEPEWAELLRSAGIVKAEEDARRLEEAQARQKLEDDLKAREQELARKQREFDERAKAHPIEEAKPEPVAEPAQPAAAIIVADARLWFDWVQVIRRSAPEFTHPAFISARDSVITAVESQMPNHGEQE